MKSVITIAAGTLALSVATRAALAAPPEYNRGYSDCLAGRYDEGEAQYSHSYRQGCRAAQEEQGATSGRINGAPRLEFPTSTEWSPSRPWARWRLVEQERRHLGGRESHRGNLLQSANGRMCPAHQCEQPGRRRARHRDRSAMPVIFVTTKRTWRSLRASRPRLCVWS